MIWNWRTSCECAGEQQRQFDATYYNRRGLFQLSRKNWELALAYLREACVQNPDSKEFQYNHRIALAAVRWHRNDEILERYLDRARSMDVNPATFLDPQDLSASGAFRNQYLSMMISAQEYQELLEALRRFETLVTRDINQGPCREWSYSWAIGNEGSSLHEIDSRSEHAQSHDPTTRELPDNSLSRSFTYELGPGSRQCTIGGSNTDRRNSNLT